MTQAKAENSALVKCVRCDGTFWVCENHTDQPGFCGNSERACKCGGAAQPCSECNSNDRDSPPIMPPDFTVLYDESGDRRH